MLYITYKKSTDAIKIRNLITSKIIIQKLNRIICKLNLKLKLKLKLYKNLENNNILYTGKGIIYFKDLWVLENNLKSPGDSLGILPGSRGGNNNGSKINANQLIASMKWDGPAAANNAV